MTILESRSTIPIATQRFFDWQTKPFGDFWCVFKGWNKFGVAVGKNWTSLVSLVGKFASFLLRVWSWRNGDGIEARNWIQPVKSLWNLLSYVYGTVYLMTDSICGVCLFVEGFQKFQQVCMIFWLCFSPKVVELPNLTKVVARWPSKAWHLRFNDVPWTSMEP